MLGIMSKKLSPFGKAGIDDCVSFLIVLRMKINRKIKETRD